MKSLRLGGANSTTNSESLLRKSWKGTAKVSGEYTPPIVKHMTKAIGNAAILTVLSAT